jgi:hypothetical protein
MEKLHPLLYALVSDSAYSASADKDKKEYEQKDKEESSRDEQCKKTNQYEEWYQTTPSRGCSSCSLNNWCWAAATACS